VASDIIADPEAVLRLVGELMRHKLGQTPVFPR
jgi:hypothetical protein